MKPLSRHALFALLIALLPALGLAAVPATTTPLIRAVKSKDAKAVEAILKSDDAQLDAHDVIFGRTALHYAAAMGTGQGDEAAEGSLLKLLLSHGVEANVIDNSNQTPLALAVSKGSVANARMLLDYGAEVGIPDQAGQAPLHRAAQRDDPAMLNLLLSRGANPAARNQMGQTALEVAIAEHHLKMIERLQAVSPPPRAAAAAPAPRVHPAPTHRSQGRSTRSSSVHLAFGADIFFVFLCIFIIGGAFGGRWAHRRRQRRRSLWDAPDPEAQASIEKLWRGIEKMEQRLQNLETILVGSTRPRV